MLQEHLETGVLRGRCHDAIRRTAARTLTSPPVSTERTGPSFTQYWRERFQLILKPSVCAVTDALAELLAA
jgi:hypothetical protein